MNAGAWGENIGSRVAWVRFLNPDGSGQVADPASRVDPTYGVDPTYRVDPASRVEAATLGFGYRSCAGLAGKVVIEAAFNVMPSNPQAVRARMEDILKRRAWLRAWPSAGSVFRNPEGDFAGRLLEQAGMKGRRIGGARVLEEHANVIVTEPSALASDVRALLEIMRQVVRERSGIELTEEIVCLE
jgi:UDP-N-acetylmuramate dehydrogenase